MHAQVYEGYVEGGQFYPNELSFDLAGRFRAVLTILDVPSQADSNLHQRMEWLNCLETAVALSADEELPDWPFERSKVMRPPIDLSD